jgi:hypothetical protein
VDSTAQPTSLSSTKNRKTRNGRTWAAAVSGLFRRCRVPRARAAAQNRPPQPTGIQPAQSLSAIPQPSRSPPYPVVGGDSAWSGSPVPSPPSSPGFPRCAAYSSPKKSKLF